MISILSSGVYVRALPSVSVDEDIAASWSSWYRFSSASSLADSASVEAEGREYSTYTQSLRATLQFVHEGRAPSHLC